MTIASRKGISWLANHAAEAPVVLTVHNRPVAVVTHPGQFDEILAELHDAARTVVEHYAELALERAAPTVSLDELCARTGMDPDEVRSLASQHAAR